MKKDVGHTLCDLGIHINLMPLSSFKALGLGVLLPTNITLLLVNKSRIASDRIVEDVVIKVQNFVIILNFIVINFEADAKLSFILSHLFFVIGRILVDVKAEKMTVKVNNEEMTFAVYKASSIPSHYKDLRRITAVKMEAEQPKIPVLLLQDIIEGDLKIKRLFCNSWKNDHLQYLRNFIKLCA